MGKHVPSKWLQCHCCDFKNKRSSVIHAHMQTEHGYTDLEQAYADAFLDGVKLTCSCTCGSALRWGSWYKGYVAKVVSGHNNSKNCAPKIVVPSKTEKCPWCSYTGGRLAIRTHAEKMHDATSQDVYDALVLGGIRPICACQDPACGKTPKFCGIKVGYSEFILGHSQKLENNFHAKGPESYKKQSETKRRQIDAGTFEVWNAGLSGEIDSRVVANSKSISESILSNPEELERRSKKMSEDRLSGIIPTQRGADHSNWNGGTSKIGPLAHERLKVWKRPILEAARFKCVHCGIGTEGELHVHHDDVRFATIVREAIGTLNYDWSDDFDTKSKVADLVVQIHVDRKISGLVLCKKCHAAEHERLGEKFNILKVEV